MPAERTGPHDRPAHRHRAARDTAIERQARAVAAVVEASAKLQRLRNRIAALDAALERVRAQVSAR